MVSIEVERRALPTEAQRTDLLDFMHSLGTVSTFNRVMIDLSSPDHTLMVRLNDGEQELVDKDGGMSDAVRKETRQQIHGATLEETLAMLAENGHTSAHVSQRRLHEVGGNGFAYSFRDVLSRTDGRRVDRLLEVERLDVEPGQEDAALAAIDNELAVHGLEAVVGESWKAWVRKVHDEVDGVFEYSVDAAANLAGNLSAAGLYIPPTSR